MATGAYLGIELDDAPQDGISSLAFSELDASLLAVSSWDKTVSLYDVAANQVKTRYAHKAAALDVAFSSKSEVVFSAGLDQVVKRFDVMTEQEEVLGHHGGGIRCVEYSKDFGFVASGSWDKTLKIWDDRTGAGSSGVAEIQTPEKIYSMATSKYRLVVAMSARVVHIYDLRQLGEPIERRRSGLKYMTRKVACIPTGESFATASIEGRVAVEHFDSSDEAQKKNFSFKCHRKQIDGVDTIYPVNALAYHPIHCTFASGGADGIVNVWDGFHKRRLMQYAAYPTSVASVGFNRDGRLLAVAASYTFEEGEKDHPADRIYVRAVEESEVRPRAQGHA